MRRSIILLALIALSVALSSRAQWAGILSASRSSGGRNIAVNTWQPFEFSTPANDSAWVTALNSAQTGDGNATGLVDTASGVLTTNATGQMTLTSTVGGVSDTGTVGLKRTYESGVVGYVGSKLAADHDTFTFGWSFKFTGSPSNNKNLYKFTTNGGGSDLCDIFFLSSSADIGFSGTAGEHTGGTYVAGTAYYVTFKYVRNTASTGMTIRVRNGAGTQIGSDAAKTSPDLPFRQFYYPTYNSASADTGVVVYWDNILIDYTGSTFPLGP